MADLAGGEPSQHPVDGRVLAVQGFGEIGQGNRRTDRPVRFVAIDAPEFRDLFEGNHLLRTQMPLVDQHGDFRGSCDKQSRGMAALQIQRGGNRIRVMEMRRGGAGAFDALKGCRRGVRFRSGFTDRAIAGAAAEVAAELVGHGVGVGGHAACRGFRKRADEARRAIAALRSAAGDHRALRRMFSAQTLRRDDPAAGKGMDEGEAGVDRARRPICPMQQHGAGAAIPFVAAALRPRQAVAAQQVEHAFMRRRVGNIQLPAIHDEGGRRTHRASSIRVWASSDTPRRIASGEAYSSGRCDQPLRQGMKIIIVGQRRAMNSES